MDLYLQDGPRAQEAFTQAVGVYTDLAVDFFPSFFHGLGVEITAISFALTVVKSN